MRFKRLVIATLAVVGLTATAGSAFAWLGHRGGDHHARIKSFVNWRLDSLLDELEADKAQRARIDTIKERMFEVGTQFAKSRPEVRQAFMDQWNADTPDKKVVHQLVDDRVDEIRAIAHQAADAALEVHSTLTPAQRATVAKMIAERHGR
jgi:Spy/CpxP family protein refolding chaperone